MEIYNYLIQDPYVKEHNIPPTKEDFKKFLQDVRIGFEYAYKKFGAEALPANLMFFETYITEFGEKAPEIMGYFPLEDTIGITYFWIAARCAFYEEKTLVSEERLQGCMVIARSMTMLQAVEECYHAYQDKVLGYTLENTYYNRSTPTELDITEVFAQAIVDLEINTYKIFK